MTFKSIVEPGVWNQQNISDSKSYKFVKSFVTTSPNLSYLHDNHWAELSCFRYKSFQIHATSNKHCIFLKHTEHVFQGQKISSAKCGLRKCCSRCKLISFISHRVIIHLVSLGALFWKNNIRTWQHFRRLMHIPGH